VDAVERQVHRVGVAAEMAAGLEQGDLQRRLAGLRTAQSPGGAQAGNAGTDDSNTVHGGSPV
jgi:hypothetical protein